MVVIKMLTDMIEEELGDAEKYAWKALKYADDRPDLAQVFWNLSREEMRHKDMLHEQVVKIIEEHRREHGEPPAAMLAIYNYLHEKFISRTHEIDLLQAQYKR